ncbi:MAG: cell division protein ZapE [Pseudomonadota bacterium]|nr:cell division protein ZapE [Pseudomonadota bacterium]
MANNPSTVSARLGAEIIAKRLQFDAAQRDAALRLDELGASLAEVSASMAARLRARLRRLSRSVPGVPQSAPQRGLYLWGGVGRGKTLLMDWFHDSLRVAACERTHFYRFMRQVHAELRTISGRPEPLDTVAQRFADKVRVLCLDEFFVSDIADAMILSGLLEGLFRRGVILVATSNVPPQELYKDGLQRQRFLPAIALLQAHVDVVHLDGGTDYRLRQLEQAPTYMDSRLQNTAAQLQRRFASLAGGSVTGPSVLFIEDRKLAVVASGPEMVWFEFRELCEGPRSQNDYIELARLYHTIFVSNIPAFTRNDENAARRFIILIDEFYDRGVKLVVSAAAPPAALYHGERLQFEFMRAASRLIEMQTQHYLAGQHRP